MLTLLKHFFQPQSVAVLGASHVPGKVGYDVLKHLIQSGYPGKIFPIHPTSSEIQGLKAYPDLLAVDDPFTRVILGYLEGISDGKAFIEVAGIPKIKEQETVKNIFLL